MIDLDRKRHQEHVSFHGLLAFFYGVERAQLWYLVTGLEASVRLVERLQRMGPFIFTSAVLNRGV